MILVVAGTVLLGYGLYTFVAPEAVVSIGSLDVIKTQDNNNSFIAIGLGLVLLFIGLLGTNSKLKI
tara:strand:+ start:17905 stop:18102 length:198 start_codon:yes stop_codon:yes gene_type:complete